MSWYTYIILCSDDSLYTGISNEPKRRFGEHQNGNGAKYFYARKPLQIVYLEALQNRSLASKREAQIKKLKAKQKRQLITSDQNQLKDHPEYFKLD